MQLFSSNCAQDAARLTTRIGIDGVEVYCLSNSNYIRLRDCPLNSTLVNHVNALLDQSAPPTNPPATPPPTSPSPTSAAPTHECVSHTACSGSTYCTSRNVCDQCGFCLSYDDGVGNTCPLRCTAAPTTAVPTTAVPTTAVPTSSQPTALPSSEPPSEADETFAPTVAPVTSEPSSTAAPATSPPTSVPGVAPLCGPSTPLPQPDRRAGTTCAVNGVATNVSRDTLRGFTADRCAALPGGNWFTYTCGQVQAFFDQSNGASLRYEWAAVCCGQSAAPSTATEPSASGGPASTAVPAEADSTLPATAAPDTAAPAASIATRTTTVAAREAAGCAPGRTFRDPEAADRCLPCRTSCPVGDRLACGCTVTADSVCVAAGTAADSVDCPTPSPTAANTGPPDEDAVLEASGDDSEAGVAEWLIVAAAGGGLLLIVAVAIAVIAGRWKRDQGKKVQTNRGLTMEKGQMVMNTAYVAPRTLQFVRPPSGYDTTLAMYAKLDGSNASYAQMTHRGGPALANPTAATGTGQFADYAALDGSNNTCGTFELSFWDHFSTRFPALHRPATSVQLACTSCTR